MNGKNEINQAYFNLICAVTANCFTSPRGNQSVIKGRISFARSKTLKIFCDCSENFNYKKLSKKIIKFNKQFIIP